MSNSDTEMKESERTVIAKPVASRPTPSNFRSFSELLAGAIDPQPPSTSTDAAIAAIRPKTVRFKPTANRSPPSAAPLTTSQIETSRSLSGNSRDNVLKPDSSSSKPTVIYKPQAKLVSRSTVSLLANMGNFEAVPHQRTTCAAEPRAVHQLSSPILRQTSEAPKKLLLLPAPQPTEEELKTLPSSSSSLANVDRPSYDGYNWRKYGQKQVKGSEYPRSYYKCTHPNCPVKKKVERSFDGQIAEIVYKGEHNHAKPQPPKKASAAQEPVNPLFESRVDEGRVEGSSHQGATLQVYEPAGGTGLNTAAGVDPDNSCGVSGECEDGSKGVEMEDDHEPRIKRRKGESSASIEAGTPTEARVMVQNATEPETAGDGFRWRKYGQKVVKGNPYPRSYYRCTSLKCNVRKHVERVSDDPNAFVTTYEGRHNHEMPVRNPNAAGPPEPEPPQAGNSKDN